MTKGELIEFLKPFTDDIEITVRFVASDSFVYKIERGSYDVRKRNGDGLVILNLDEHRIIST